MSYQWSIGEPCIFDPEDGYRGKATLKIGAYTYVEEIDGTQDASPGDDEFKGMRIRVFGETYLTDHDERTEEWSDGADFRPLHGTDIRKLEEKYPEYVIKTNEVEG